MTEETPPRPSLLIVDDDVGFVQAVAELANEEGFAVTIAGSLAQARSRLARACFDVALVDLGLPDGDGMGLLPLMDGGQRTQIIVVTGRPTVDTALQAMHLPIADYLVKPLAPRRLLDLLERGRRRRSVAPQRGGDVWHGLVGTSPPMQDLRRQIRRVAPTGATVFIEGESGVGKELVAAALHAESGREGPFVAVNCAAVPAELLSSQLFGHERGAFTGASQRHTGLFEQARGGTLFLDEITEMPIELQAHLLRALETGRIRRLGDDQERPFDARVVAASNRPPEEAVRERRLRHDLYYRLAEFPLRVPTLRERPGDIAALADAFLQRLGERHGRRPRLSAEAVEQLRRHDWPGNVRELRNAVQRAFILAEDDVVSPVPAATAAASAPDDTDTTLVFRVGTPLHEMERRMLLRTLAWFGNDKAKAARALGITARTIHNRLAAYAALDTEDDGPGDVPTSRH